MPEDKKKLTYPLTPKELEEAESSRKEYLDYLKISKLSDNELEAKRAAKERESQNAFERFVQDYSPVSPMPKWLNSPEDKEQRRRFANKIQANREAAMKKWQERGPDVPLYKSVKEKYLSLKNTLGNMLDSK